jgi:hypothetical protein
MLTNCTATHRALNNQKQATCTRNSPPSVTKPAQYTALNIATVRSERPHTYLPNLNLVTSFLRHKISQTLIHKHNWSIYILPKHVEGPLQATDIAVRATHCTWSRHRRVQCKKEAKERKMWPGHTQHGHYNMRSCTLMTAHLCYYEGTKNSECFAVLVCRESASHVPLTYAVISTLPRNLKNKHVL